MQPAPVSAPWPDHLDTEQFRAWFGQSQVVDAQGRPLVVYHGTTPWTKADGRQLGDIEAFDRMASVNIVRRRPSVDTLGSWFSSEPGQTGAEMYSGSTGAIYPVHLAIARPWRVTFASMVRIGHRMAGTDPDTVMVAPGVMEPAAFRFGQAQVDGLRTWLKTMGYDGIALKADPNKAGNDEFAGQQAWIALEPSQIKSAIANNGDYNPEDPRLCFKRAAEPEPAADEDEEDRACAPRF